MDPIVYVSSDTYPVALLIKKSAYVKSALEYNYIKPLQSKGISAADLIFCDLAYNDAGKAPAPFIKEYLTKLLPALASVSVKHIYCADAGYFKVLTNSRKAEPHLGYVLKCAIKGYEHMDVILGVNYASLIHNPANEGKLALSIETLAQTAQGTYKGLGNDIIKQAAYPSSHEDIKQALASLHQHPVLTCDTETFSLKHDKAGLGTISFSWSQHEGLAFACDYQPLTTPEDGFYGEQVINEPVRKLIREFLETYQGTLVYHNATFDIKILIAALWMDNLLDQVGLLRGLEILTRKFEDTKIISYLALNTCADYSLSLKDLAHLFAGNWAQDEIKDIRRIPLNTLLEYNLIDGLSTWYTGSKYTPMMIADQQQELYYKLMLPSIKTIIQVELTGMPLDKRQVLNARRKLMEIIREQDDLIYNSPVVKQFTQRLQNDAWVKDYEDRKAKAKNPDKIKQKDLSAFASLVFNTGSSQQLAKLLFEEMQLPVLSRTPTKQPETGGEILEHLVNHTNNPEYKALLEALVMKSEAAKILSTFIKAFLLAIDKGDDVVYLHGNFNLGGTVSGRLSSSDPNLQNMPAKSTYGKLIKACFRAPKGWIFTSADFKSLEDMISALQTKDPNKLKVYLDGFDGHCLRAFTYWPEKLPGIVNTVESINSIEDKFPEVRQDSKQPTFLLTYQGTWHGMVKKLGFEPDAARATESRYKTLYRASVEWVQDKLNKASQDGYVTLAFGLRLRTPILASTIRGLKSTPKIADQEGRTAGNALGQSYGLLNNRAANEFMEKVWQSEHRHHILPIAMIHDALYFLMRDNVDTINWANQELIKSMEWQELPEIQHETVKLGAQLVLHWPTWAEEIKLPNNSTVQQIWQLCKAAKDKFLSKDKAA